MRGNLKRNAVLLTMAVLVCAAAALMAAQQPVAI